jgi:hypothetical protein
MQTGKVTLLTLALVLIHSLAFGGVSGTSSVDFGTGEFDGYWCYTIDFTWDSAQSLSNISNFLGLDGLVCACEPGLFLFPSPSGTTTGEEDGIPCTLSYEGEYLCNGNPSLPPEFANATAIKWDPAPEPCSAGTTGSGTVLFYSLLAPSPDELHPGVLVVKSNTSTIVGDVTGPLPAANCGVDHEFRSLGQIKARFDK